MCLDRVQTESRPVGNGVMMLLFLDVPFFKGHSAKPKRSRVALERNADHNPLCGSLRDGARPGGSQAMNCPATIIWSLRDKGCLATTNH
jgi:hypothetical protein